MERAPKATYPPSDLERLMGTNVDLFTPPGLGWHQSLRDLRDYSPDLPAVRELLGLLPESESPPGALPGSVDLREFFPDVYDQQNLNSSTAQACVGLVEYFERRVHGRTVRPSRMFLYKTARSLLQTFGDHGADLRTVLKAMVCFGVPPERYWPYEVERCDREPEPFLYSFADRYRPIRYVRLDGRNATGPETLEVVKGFLAAGFPAVFGFPVPTSISLDSDVPYRPQLDSVRGGQAVVAVGYDDKRLRTTRGALLIRNSWGRPWADDGYGWLPYAYVEEQLAVDFWTLLHPAWLRSGEFTSPSRNHAGAC